MPPRGHGEATDHAGAAECDVRSCTLRDCCRPIPLGWGNDASDTSSIAPLVFDLPCRAARSGLKMGVGCPLTSFLLDRVEVVH